MRILALAILALFVATFALAASGLDVGCSDDCERGAPCKVVCVACGCSALIAPPHAAPLPPAAAQRLSTPAFAETPLAGIARGVLHVPLSPAAPLVT